MDFSGWQFWLGLAILAVVAVSRFWPAIQSGWSRLPSIGSLIPQSATPKKPDRDAAIDHFNAAYAYLEEVNCQEGMKAMLDALPHFYHHQGQHS